MRWLSVKLLPWLLPAALVSAQSCASSEADVASDGDICNTPDCLPMGDASSDASADAIVADSPSVPDSMAPEAPRCGTGCLPDNPDACTQFGAGDAGNPDGDLGADSGDGGSRGCGVVREVGGALESECQPAGMMTEGGPCTSSADCAAGHACIAFQESAAQAGQCRPYCCEGSCSDDGMYCADRPLLLANAMAPNTPLQVPVCVRAENCRLDELCDAGTGCACPAGTACTVVGKNGLTGCVQLEPNASDAPGEPCPCAVGYVCSSASQTCLEVCSLSDLESCEYDANARCQANPALPDGFGTCTISSLEPSR